MRCLGRPQLINGMTCFTNVVLRDKTNRNERRDNRRRDMDGSNGWNDKTVVQLVEKQSWKLPPDTILHGSSKVFMQRCSVPCCCLAERERKREMGDGTRERGKNDLNVRPHFLLQ
jgi:hypothetical protein